jgi:hypothetical protein
MYFRRVFSQNIPCMKQLFTILFIFCIFSVSNAQTPEPLILEVEEVSIPGSDDIALHLFCSNFDQIKGFQFSINWDILELKFMKVDSFGPSHIFNTNNNCFPLRPESLTAIWGTDDPCVTLEDGSRMISLRFKRLSGIGKYKISNTPIPIEVLNCNDQLVDVIFIDNFGGVTYVRNGIVSNTMEIESAKISVFPNPAQDKIFFKWNDLQHPPDQAIIYNMYGQLIGQRAIADKYIDLPESILTGTYLLMLKKEGETVAIKKVQVQK